MLLKIKAILYPLYFKILVTTIVIFFFEKLVDLKNDKVKFGVIPKTNEKYISVTYGCISFIDKY